MWKSLNRFIEKDSDFYVGFETGDDEVLTFYEKGNTAEEAVQQGRKLAEANLMFNAIIMYGIAGKGKSVRNAKLTAKMLNQLNPRKIITMNLTVFQGTELAHLVEKQEFVEAGVREKKRRDKSSDRESGCREKRWSLIQLMQRIL